MSPLSFARAAPRAYAAGSPPPVSEHYAHSNWGRGRETFYITPATRMLPARLCRFVLFCEYRVGAWTYLEYRGIETTIIAIPYPPPSRQALIVFFFFFFLLRETKRGASREPITIPYDSRLFQRAFTLHESFSPLPILTVILTSGRSRRYHTPYIAS